MADNKWLAVISLSASGFAASILVGKLLVGGDFNALNYWTLGLVSGTWVVWGYSWLK